MAEGSIASTALPVRIWSPYFWATSALIPTTTSKVFIFPDWSCGKSQLTFWAILELTANPQSPWEAETQDTYRATHSLKSRRLCRLSSKVGFSCDRSPKVSREPKRASLDQISVLLHNSWQEKHDGVKPNVAPLTHISTSCYLCEITSTCTSTLKLASLGSVSNTAPQGSRWYCNILPIWITLTKAKTHICNCDMWTYQTATVMNHLAANWT